MNKSIHGPVSGFLILSLLLYSSARLQAEMIDSVIAPGEIEQSRAERLEQIGRVLTFKLVRQRLLDYGVSPLEVERQLSNLDSEQIRTLAHASQQVLAGADRGGEHDHGDHGPSLLGLVLIIAIIVLLIVLILKLSGKEISIE